MFVRMQYKSLKVILSPYHLGVLEQGVGLGPAAILDAGLLTSLKALSIVTETMTIGPVDTFEGEIGRSFELMRRISSAVRLTRGNAQLPLVLAGNCFSSVGVCAGIDDIPHDELGIVWHDAHDDYHTPDTLSSGYFDAQRVSMLTGESWDTLVNSIPGFKPLCKENVMFCGVRDVTGVERQRLLDAGFPIVWGTQSHTTSNKPAYFKELQELLRHPAAPKNIMIHWDLDSLDSDLVGQVNKFSAPDGLTPKDLVGIAEMLPRTVTPVSLTVASFDPTTSEDKGATVARVAVRGIMALVKGLIVQGMLATSSHDGSQ